MENRLVKTLDLDNGATLNLFDASRKIAGDRWLVSLLARLEAPVEKILSRIDDTLPVPPYRIVEAVGESVVHEKREERNFVDDDAREAVWDELHGSFMETSLPYLSAKNFPLRLILKKYTESRQESKRDD